MDTQTSPIAGTFVADKDHSSALFTVQHMKVSRFRGSFSDIDARLTGSDAGLSLEGSAKVASISITNPATFRRTSSTGPISSMPDCSRRSGSAPRISGSTTTAP